MAKARIVGFWRWKASHRRIRRKALEYFRNNIRLDPSEQEARINTGETSAELGKSFTGVGSSRQPLPLTMKAIAALRAMPNEKLGGKHLPLSYGAKSVRSASSMLWDGCRRRREAVS